MLYIFYHKNGFFFFFQKWLLYSLSNRDNNYSYILIYRTSFFQVTEMQLYGHLINPE